MVWINFGNIWNLIQPIERCSYLDRGLDLPSDPDASLPLLLVPKNDEVFSFPSDGLGTLPLPVITDIKGDEIKIIIIFCFSYIYS